MNLFIDNKTLFKLFRGIHEMVICQMEHDDPPPGIGVSPDTKQPWYMDIHSELYDVIKRCASIQFSDAIRSAPRDTFISLQLSAGFIKDKDDTVTVEDDDFKFNTVDDNAINDLADNCADCWYEQLTHLKEV
ncbi:MAG: hypothetical protein IKQ22_03585 [Clostridia bacterium]|nr:hypothetical protein [Clostridia bacterium]